jgi:hypothetical protein
LLSGGKIFTDCEPKTGDNVPHNNTNEKDAAITKQVMLFNTTSQFSDLIQKDYV